MIVDVQCLRGLSKNFVRNENRLLNVCRKIMFGTMSVFSMVFFGQIKLGIGNLVNWQEISTN